MSDKVGYMNGITMSRWSTILYHHSSFHMQEIKSYVTPLKRPLSRPNSFSPTRHSIRPSSLVELPHIFFNINLIPLQPTLTSSFRERQCIHTQRCRMH